MTNTQLYEILSMTTKLPVKGEIILGDESTDFLREDEVERLTEILLHKDAIVVAQKQMDEVTKVIKFHFDAIKSLQTDVEREAEHRALSNRISKLVHVE